MGCAKYSVVPLPGGCITLINYTGNMNATNMTPNVDTFLIDTQTAVGPQSATFAEPYHMVGQSLPHLKMLRLTFTQKTFIADMTHMANQTFL